MAVRMVIEERAHLKVGYRLDKMKIVAHDEGKGEWVLKCDCGARRRYKTEKLLRLFPSSCSKCNRTQVTNISLGGSAELIRRDYDEREKELIEQYLRERARR